MVSKLLLCYVSLNGFYVRVKFAIFFNPKIHEINVSRKVHVIRNLSFEFAKNQYPYRENIVLLHFVRMAKFTSNGVNILLRTCIKTIKESLRMETPLGPGAKKDGCFHRLVLSQWWSYRQPKTAHFLGRIENIGVKISSDQKYHGRSEIPWEQGFVKLQHIGAKITVMIIWVQILSSNFWPLPAYTDVFD